MLVTAALTFDKQRASHNSLLTQFPGNQDSVETLTAVS